MQFSPTCQPLLNSLPKFQVEKSLENQLSGQSEVPSIEIQEATEDCINYLSALDHEDRHDPGKFQNTKLVEIHDCQTHHSQIF